MGSLSRHISMRSTISLPALKTCSALSSQKPGGILYLLSGNVGSSSGPTGPWQRIGKNGMYSLYPCEGLCQSRSDPYRVDGRP